jgi:hypothetical protein
MEPQLTFLAAHVVGVHPQRFGWPFAPQTLPSVQVPQSSICPQPSDTVPHSAPRCGQVHGVHPHFFEMAPPPQV